MRRFYLFRMALAVFQYFNIFSMMYTGKPLVTNKGACMLLRSTRGSYLSTEIWRMR